LGPSDEIEGFPEGYAPLGKPLNLQPPGTIFKNPDDFNDLRPPIKIFIPCPGFLDASGISVFLYDEVNHSWVLAENAKGNIQLEAEDWLAAKPVLHDYDQANDTPARIEVQLYHFSGAQAGVPAGASGGGSAGVIAGGSAGGGCFISALRGGNEE